jgi:predicted Zn-dependent protease
MAPLLADNRVSSTTFEAELRAAFDLWSAVADVRFVRATSAETADILIGAQAEPRGRAFTNIEFDRSGPPGGFRTLTQSTICFSPAERWKIGFDGDLEVYDLRYTLLHEIGHAIGLDHPAIDSQLMDFRYSERFRAPQGGDVLGAVALYGASRGVATVSREGEPTARRVVRARDLRPETGG